MHVMALDTSTWQLSAALVSIGADGGWSLLAGAEHSTGRGMHSRLLPGLLIDLMERARLPRSRVDGFAVGLGPGSFTGLRTGLATVASMAYGGRVPLAGASSLASMALSAATGEASRQPTPANRDSNLESSLLVPILDARRGQVYAGFYRCGSSFAGARGPSRSRGALAEGPVLESVAADAVMEPAELLRFLDEQAGDAVLFGSGLSAATSIERDARSRPDLCRSPSAVAIARLCAKSMGSYSPERLFQVRPTYVRQRVVDDDRATPPR